MNRLRMFALAAALSPVTACAQITFTGTSEFGARELTAEDVGHALAPVRQRSIMIPKDRQAARAAVADPARRLALQLNDDGKPDELSPVAKQQLDVVAAALQSKELGSTHFLISGHTSSAVDPDAAVKTSQRWADTVKAYLLSAHKLDADRFEAVGRGPYEPLDPAYPDSAANRRVQFVAVD